jgi:hypothetical protein
MSDDKPTAAGATDQPERRTRSFRKYPPAVRLSPEQLRRQDAVLQSAWRSLSAAGPVIAFLNSHNESLGAQPLHLALDSDEGLVRVERLLGEIALRA